LNTVLTQYASLKKKNTNLSYKDDVGETYDKKFRKNAWFSFCFYCI